MSQIIIEDEAWKRIMADNRLQRARSRLSFHEIRLIVQHVRDSDAAPRGREAAEAEGQQRGPNEDSASPNTSPATSISHPSQAEGPTQGCGIEDAAHGDI